MSKQAENEIKKITVKKYKGFFQAIGKRKSAIARVRITDKGDQNGIVINDKPIEEYFRYPIWQSIVYSPIVLVADAKKYFVSVKVNGGGPVSQAKAIRHGIARVLLMFEPLHRPALKAAGFLKRDPRVKERKKPGLKRARRAPQWAKR
ncbi:MAG: 30S ribosomal protein S9 [Candidatus Komeilibacteria bacterium CG_4_9_14_0_8_um_filter_36_9]|uniref:Small ribosomal subunit protein uS9 n=2 Tax=Candidatus Komeiliibacteriota TaxID=1817908 RepID=A0A2M8DQN6_9BACT|nr:MAG: 30S ribosomal protein S9 [Candidatus Komeilibacteria bacterium CG_4_10_14_0_8_um_filter_37_78]PJC01459.1 MAG: 30S ribosomal protein S9 [Candidatus Komeilibacteria bacterium CG_4_9_14_0_8_um_filter_36_9]